MKPVSVFGACVIAVSAALAMPHALAHGDHGKPQYGGIHGEAGVFQLELVPGEQALTFYATSHGDPIATTGASGKVTIMGADGTTTTATLAPAGSNQLVARVKARPAKGSKVVASVTLPGMATANIRYVIAQ